MDNPEFKRPNIKPDFEAEITALKTEEGGRTNPFYSGYHPNHDFGLNGMLNDAKHEYPDGGIIRPGQKGRAFLWLHYPDYQKNRLYEGMEFTVQEGNKIVGKGKIIKIINQELIKINS